MKTFPLGASRFSGRCALHIVLIFDTNIYVDELRMYDVGFVVARLQGPSGTHYLKRCMLPIYIETKFRTISALAQLNKDEIHIAKK